MLKLNNQGRGSGKTSKVIELMKKDEKVLCLVPLHSIKRNLFPSYLHDRIIVVTSDFDEIVKEMRSRRIDKLVIDELLYSKFEIAELFYKLGKVGADVIVYGTDKEYE